MDNKAQSAPIFIAHNLKLLRKHMELSQQEFGKLLGVPRPTINTYEGGVVPSLKVVAHICSTFRLDINRFTFVQATVYEQLKNELPPNAIEATVQQQFSAFEQASLPQKLKTHKQLLYKYHRLVQFVQGGLLESGRSEAGHPNKEF